MDVPETVGVGVGGVCVVALVVAWLRTRHLSHERDHSIELSFHMKWRREQRDSVEEDDEQ